MRRVFPNGMDTNFVEKIKEVLSKCEIFHAHEAHESATTKIVIWNGSTFDIWLFRG